MSSNPRGNPVLAIHEAPLPYYDALDATRGIPSAELIGIDPQQRITLPSLAHYIGAQLGEFSTSVEGVAGEPLITRDVLLNALIAPKNARKPLLVRAPYGAPRTTVQDGALQLPNQNVHDMAVAFWPADHTEIIKSPQGLARDVMARVAKSNRPLESQTEKERRMHSGAAQALAGKSALLEALQMRISKERTMALSLFRQVREPARVGGTPQNQYKAENLARAMHGFDVLFFKMLQTAGQSSGWPTAQLHAAQKASVAARYKAPDSDTLMAAWRDQIGTFGLYTNARLHRLAQIQAATATEQQKHEPYRRVHYTDDKAAA